MNWLPTFSRLSQWKCEKNDKHVRSKHLLIRSSSDYKIEVIVDKKYDFDHARPILHTISSIGMREISSIGMRERREKRTMNKKLRERLDNIESFDEIYQCYVLCVHTF